MHMPGLTICSAQRSFRCVYRTTVFAEPSLISASCRSLYTPAYNIALNDQLGMLPRGVPPLSVYCANFYFAIGMLSIALAVNTVAFRWPPFSLQRCTAVQYLQDNRFRAVACVSGLLAW